MWEKISSCSIGFPITGAFVILFLFFDEPRSHELNSNTEVLMTPTCVKKVFRLILSMGAWCFMLGLWCFKIRNKVWFVSDFVKTLYRFAESFLKITNLNWNFIKVGVSSAKINLEIILMSFRHKWFYFYLHQNILALALLSKHQPPFRIWNISTQLNVLVF